MPTHWIPMPILRLICNAMPTRVVSVHVVSYAYSILCHSCVTYVVPYPAYIVSYCMSTYSFLVLCVYLSPMPT